jgi:hypothetical protein
MFCVSSLSVNVQKTVRKTDCRVAREYGSFGDDSDNGRDNDSQGESTERSGGEGRGGRPGW